MYLIHVFWLKITNKLGEICFRIVYTLNIGDIKYTVDSRYLEIEGTLKNSSRYPNFDISDL